MMLQRLRERLHGHKNKREKGAADMVATLVLTPLVIMMIFAMIDISLWLNTKSHVESAVRDGARIAAMWGGSGGPKDVRLNTTKSDVEAIIRGNIYDTKKKTCTISHCTSAPSVACSPNVAKSAGTKITCTVTYRYKSIFPGADLLGFGGITQDPFTYSTYAISETGYR